MRTALLSSGCRRTAGTVKSEDILYEIKKIQQVRILEEGMKCESCLPGQVGKGS